MASGEPGVTLRLARKGDAADLCRLLGQLGFPITRERTEARLREVLGAPDHALLVADVEGRAVGLAELRRVRLLTAWRQVDVVALVVDEAYRRRGVARRLLEEAERWAYDLRCSKLRVRSNATRERAHSLYRRSGYEAARTDTLFEKQLGSVRPKAAAFTPTSVISRSTAGTVRGMRAGERQDRIGATSGDPHEGFAGSPSRGLALWSAVAGALGLATGALLTMRHWRR